MWIRRPPAGITREMWLAAARGNPVAYPTGAVRRAPGNGWTPLEDFAQFVIAPMTSIPTRYASRAGLVSLLVDRQIDWVAEPEALSVLIGAAEDALPVQPYESATDRGFTLALTEAVVNALQMSPTFRGSLFSKLAISLRLRLDESLWREFYSALPQQQQALHFEIAMSGIALGAGLERALAFATATRVPERELAFAVASLVQWLINRGESSLALCRAAIVESMSRCSDAQYRSIQDILLPVVGQLEPPLKRDSIVQKWREHVRTWIENPNLIEDFTTHVKRLEGFHAEENLIGQAIDGIIAAESVHYYDDHKDELCRLLSACRRYSGPRTFDFCVDVGIRWATMSHSAEVVNAALIGIDYNAQRFENLSSTDKERLKLLFESMIQSPACEDVIRRHLFTFTSIDISAECKRLARKPGTNLQLLERLERLVGLDPAPFSFERELMRAGEFDRVKETVSRYERPSDPAAGHKLDQILYTFRMHETTYNQESLREAATQ